MDVSILTLASENISFSCCSQMKTNCSNFSVFESINTLIVELVPYLWYHIVFSGYCHLFVKDQGSLWLILCNNRWVRRSKSVWQRSRPTRLSPRCPPRTSWRHCHWHEEREFRELEVREICTKVPNLNKKKNV